MNERIKELTVQARNYALGQKQHYEGVHSAEQCMEDYREVYNTKFAELIVRECAESLWTEECRTSDLASEEYTRGSNKIKEHFGVEE